MPPTRFAGLSFLVSLDDLIFAALPSVLIHAVWVVLDFARQAQAAVAKMNINPGLLDIDAYMCCVVIVLDILIAKLSSEGEIMQKRRHERSLKCLVVVRLIAGVPLFLIYAYAVFNFCAYAFRCQFMGLNKGEFDDLAKHASGWGPMILSFWPLLMVQLFMALRLVFVIPGAFFLIAVVIDKDTHGELALSGVRAALRLFGVRDDFHHEVVKVLMDVVGHGTSDILTPSDVLFGLCIVAARQKQGVLFCDMIEDQEDSDEEEGTSSDEQQLAVNGRRKLQLPSNVARACEVCGEHKAPVPLSSSNLEDLDALRQITHYVAFANGIYGVAIEVMVNSVHRHSSLPNLGRYIGAICRALPCRQRRSPHPITVAGDICFNLHESALRRTMLDHSRKTRCQEPELVWATWENRGTGTAPPMAAFLDFETQTVVVAVRGTFDFKDCLGDLAASPAFFDPLKLAPPGHPETAPFNDATDFFVHTACLRIAQDALSRLEEVGVLERVLAPSGPASGWKVVCVGHSLGAGVACLLALLLRATGKPHFSHTHCVCFEPPGGLMSQRLSEETGRMGFISAVCAHDWIPRLSIRALQELRERLIIELEECHRCKWSLALLMVSTFIRRGSRLTHSLRLLFRCFQPIASLIECIAGGPLDLKHASSSRNMTRPGFAPLRKTRGLLQEAHTVCQGHTKKLADLPKPELTPELWPPRSVVYFRPVTVDWWFCGLYQAATEWAAEWVQPEELHELIISYRSVELHFPNIIRDAYFSAAEQLGAREHFSSSSGSDDSPSDSGI